MESVQSVFVFSVPCCLVCSCIHKHTNWDYSVWQWLSDNGYLQSCPGQKQSRNDVFAQTASFTRSGSCLQSAGMHRMQSGSEKWIWVWKEERGAGGGQAHSSYFLVLLPSPLHKCPHFSNFIIFSSPFQGSFTPKFTLILFDSFVKVFSIMHISMMRQDLTLTNRRTNSTLSWKCIYQEIVQMQKTVRWQYVWDYLCKIRSELCFRRRALNLFWNAN